MHASMVHVPTCQKHANFSFLKAKVPVNEATCQRCANYSICVPTCQRLAKFSTWHANVANEVPIFHFGMPTCQKACQIFKHFSYKMLREISILYYYIKNSILDIIVIHMICTCIIHKFLYISILPIMCKGKCVEFLFFETFLFFS